MALSILIGVVIGFIVAWGTMIALAHFEARRWHGIKSKQHLKMFLEGQHTVNDFRVLQGFPPISDAEGGNVIVPRPATKDNQ